MNKEKVTKDSIKVVLEAILGNDQESQTDSWWTYMKNKYVKDSEVILERFLSNFFQQAEGPFACTDKARFVVKQIFKALESKEHQPLIQTYGKNDRGMPEDEITYWSPLGFESTNDVMCLIDAYFTFNIDLFKKLLDESRKVFDKNWSIKYLNKKEGDN